ncbi:ETX/MTX2 family pore-forming toxin [Saccharothrix coeruleofusca]|uniref:Uncharacterized protein n=1 Tax=Saccharothrix coeruleofusca TaxID=33919 RepID=A0A918APC9_9PSEU|nr:ETX/MTX2 family pore-forming toxin [Saccharothrix coeruleofusca]MBP2336346.1 hypothetical protein [Saccharothrix coeruleofusca]GGP53786.1 hypothetical protein GCM10010185_27570 [Saccharothrix coeruleofusca]
MRDPVEVIRQQIRGEIPEQDFRFDRFDVTLGLAALRYTTLDVEDQRAVVVRQSVFTNDTDNTRTRTFAVDETTTDTFGWTLSEALRVGTTFEVPVPLVDDDGVRAELDLTSTRPQTTAVTRHWRYRAQIPVPARCRVQTTFSVLEGRISTPFTAVLQVRGFLDIRWADGGSWKRCFGEVAEMIEKGYRVPDPAAFQCTTGGRFTGAVATGYRVHTRNLVDGSTRQLFPVEPERSTALTR